MMIAVLWLIVFDATMAAKELATSLAPIPARILLQTNGQKPEASDDKESAPPDSWLGLPRARNQEASLVRLPFIQETIRKNI